MHGQPRVTILDPRLEMHWDYAEPPIPHVYRVGRSFDRPVLCLFDVEAGEWTPNDLMADTTLKWASIWLNFYEGWLVTKKWFGGGRHASAAAGEKEIQSGGA